MPCHAMPCNAMSCYSMIHYDIWYGSVWHDMTWYDMIWHILLYGMIRYDVLLYDVLWYEHVWDGLPIWHVILVYMVWRNARRCGATYTCIAHVRESARIVEYVCLFGWCMFILMLLFIIHVLFWVFKLYNVRVAACMQGRSSVPLYTFSLYVHMEF